MSDNQGRLNEINNRFSNLYKSTPNLMGAFQNLMGEAAKDAEFSSAIKELIALALAVAKGCEDCIIFHASKAKQQGATREELVEVLGVCIEMGGGPSAVYAAKSLEIFDNLEA